MAWFIGGFGFTWFYRTPVLVETPGLETRIEQKSDKWRVHFLVLVLLCY
jgi:hypothetical protein